MQHTISIQSFEGLGRAAREFISLTQGRPLIAFRASMGAGKTTFIKALCEELGVPSEEIASPTFSIVNEYLTAGGESICHFDFYRITRPAEALDIGLYDYLDSGKLCLMEWPENVEDLLPDDTLSVSIRVEDDGTRILSWED